MRRLSKAPDRQHQPATTQQNQTTSHRRVRGIVAFLAGLLVVALLGGTVYAVSHSSTSDKAAKITTASTPSKWPWTQAQREAQTTAISDRNNLMMSYGKLQSVKKDQDAKRWYDHFTPKPAPKSGNSSGTQSTTARRTGVDWDGIADCETGGNWSMSGSTYSGGVGFANTTWEGFGGGQFAPNAGQASREEQIVVAERVYARYGLSGWGCRRFG